MHPLCCMPIDLLTNRSTTLTTSLDEDDRTVPPIGNVGGGVAGLLQKWTNYSKGWRSRWFLLRNGVLSYSKSCRSDNLIAAEVRTIGDVTVSFKRSSSVNDRRSNRRQSVGVVHLKVCRFCRVRWRYRGLRCTRWKLEF